LPEISLAAATSSADDKEKIPVVNGGALVKHNKLEHWLPERQMEGYRFITSKINKGAIVIENPLGDGKLSFTIKESKARLSWENETLIIKIKGIVNLAEILGNKAVIGEKNSEKKLLEAKVS